MRTFEKLSSSPRAQAFVAALVEVYEQHGLSLCVLPDGPTLLVEGFQQGNVEELQEAVVYRTEQEHAQDVFEQER